MRPIEDVGELAGYLAKYSTKSTEQVGGLLHPVDADSVETAPVSEHVRGYLRAAFKLHELAQQVQAQHRDTEREEYRRSRAEKSASSECMTTRDGAASLASRARQAQGHEETVRIRQLDGTEHTGRIERIATTEPRPEQSDETLVLTMAGGPAIRLAEIQLIAAPRPPEPKRAADRADPRLAANGHNSATPATA